MKLFKMLKNFSIDPVNMLSKKLVSMDIYDSDQLLDHLKRLPYGRNSDRANYNLVLTENKGTCATKHAFFKQVANENSIESIKLFIGVYAMNEDNTPGIGAVLDPYDLDYIPEAHTYVRVNDTILDITRDVESVTPFSDSLLYEEEIQPQQIGAHKVKLHQDYLRSWIIKNQCKFDFETLWGIREKCILALSKNQP